MPETSTAIGVRRAGGDRDTEFTAYMQARRTSLMRTAYLLAGDHATAEDLVQTALAKLYLSWDRVPERDSLDGYVRRILVNENSSLWRRAFKRSEVSSQALPERGVSDEYDDGVSAQLWAFVQTLPRKQRAVVVLRFLEELSVTETAEALRMSSGAVRSNTHRALRSLRGELEPEEDGGVAPVAPSTA